MERVRLRCFKSFKQLLTNSSILDDESPLPSSAATEEEDAFLLQDEPFVDGPVKIDYGFNIRYGTSPSVLITSHPLTRYRLGKGVQINYDSTFIDTCPITIGARTLIGPNCSFYSGTHPLDPFLRNGMEGPELGARIDIGEDCWFGGNVVVCPGVKIGRGVTVGAGSVVTRDVDDFCVVAGNPARVLRRLEVNEKDLMFAGDV